ncbi:MAG: ribonuclease HII [Peptococcales bacterium]
MLPEKWSVLEIEGYLASLNENEQEKFLKLLANDQRKTVQKLVQKHHSLRTKKLVEKERILKMWEFEKKLYNNNYKFIVGIDEAGRGPLAGPIVAGAVILPPFCFIEGLNDSKQLSQKRRELIAKEIKSKAIKWAVGIVDAQTIDKINILEATRYAMCLAVRSLGVLPEYALVDGEKNSLLKIPQLGIIKGDSLSASIAAASIIAKVTRDNIMEAYDKIYPGFNFAANKGYGTQQHLMAILNNGCCPIHRRTFAPIKERAYTSDQAINFFD